MQSYVNWNHLWLGIYPKVNKDIYGKLRYIELYYVLQLQKVAYWQLPFLKVNCKPKVSVSVVAILVKNKMIAS